VRRPDILTSEFDVKRYDMNHYIVGVNFIPGMKFIPR
jgi:hypothetical protein